MSYSEYTGSTAPRPIRVVLGGAIAITCCCLGFIYFTHHYHRALMMKEQPEELDWRTLADRGPIDNAFIRLIDVELDQSSPFEELEDIFGDFEPGRDADPEEALEAFAGSMEDVNPLEMVQMAIAPIKIIPKGAEKDAVPELIVMDRIEPYIVEAERQLEETGTLSGFVTSYHGDEFVRAILEYSDDDELLEEFDKAAPDQTVYIIEPMAEAISSYEAGWNFWLCGFGFSFGLILCGSGGPVLSTFIYWTVPTLISLLGYPMRYGRGGATMRVIYMAIGSVFVYYGYQLMIVHGKMGQLDGIAIFQSMGFVSLFIGFAGVLSVPSQILTRKIEASMDVAPSPQKKVKMTLQEACSLKPLDIVETIYSDRQLVLSAVDETSDELRQLAESLTTVGFEPPEPRCWQDGEQVSPAAIQIGCQEMVVSDIEIVEGRKECRMVSVLHDGMMVITLSSAVKSGADRRIGSNGTYQRSKSDKPDQMLAQHLETTISIAERRDTSVVIFDVNEIADVCHLGRRVFADIQHQYGESVFEVDAAGYGRFHYPMQPIPEGVMA